MVTWWLLVDLLNILANIDCLKTWLVSIKRSFWGLVVAFKTVRIVEELMEIWPNEICDTLVVYTIVSQVALLPSYNSKATVSSLCSLPILIYSNFSQFISIFTEFIWILWNLSREYVKKAAWSVLSQLPLSHVWSCIHSRQGFYLGLWPFLNPLLILCY